VYLIIFSHYLRTLNYLKVESTYVPLHFTLTWQVNILGTLVRFVDLATERERHLTTGKLAERTKLDFRCSICRSAIGQASCFASSFVVKAVDLLSPSSTDVPVLLLNQHPTGAQRVVGSFPSKTSFRRGFLSTHYHLSSK